MRRTGPEPVRRIQQHMPDAPVILKAGCKVNLTLRILERRRDGYHDIESLFYPLQEPHDLLTVTAGKPGQGLELSCTDPSLEGVGNILIKTWHLFAEKTGSRPDVRVHLKKRIPTGAGLGGGSSDAAVFLRYLAHSFSPGLSESALNSLGRALGADVPFFLSPAPSLVTGVGERLQPVPVDLEGLELLLVCPRIHVCTAWAYAEWDRLALSHGGNRLTILDDRNTNPRLRTGLRLVNDFEPVVFPHFPELRRLKELLFQCGAAASVLSGSGASLTALFRSGDQAEAAQVLLKERSIPSYTHPL